MKKLFVLCIVLSLCLCGCAQKETAPKNRLEEIKERGYITVATEPYFAPNEFIDSSKKGEEQYVGSDIEMAKYIAEKLDVDLKIVPLEFTAVLSSVTEGKYDLAISALDYSEDRAQAMNMSKAYYYGDDTDGYGLLVKAGQEDKYATASDLENAVIAVQSGSTQQSFVNGQVPKCKEIKLVSSMNDAFLMVQEGKADVAACFLGNAKLYCEANSDVMVANQFRFTEDKEKAGTRIGMEKGQDELTEKINEIIDQMQQEDLYKQWYKEYADYAKTLGIE